MLEAPHTTGPVTRAIRSIRTEPEPQPARRGFLRSLATLPLIGGSIALIGTPTAVAAKPSQRLLLEYESWLTIEARRIAVELRGPDMPMTWEMRGSAFEWHGGRGFSEPGINPAASRAALVLSAVGCDWRD